MIGIAIFSIVLLYFTYRGYRLGLGLVLARFASLIGAYYIAVKFAATGAALLSEETPLEGLAAYYVTGIAIFIVSAIVFSIVLRILLHILGKGSDDDSRLAIPGAAVNGLIGIFVGLGLVWIVNMANTAFTQGELPEDNFVNNWSQKLVGGTVDAVLSQQFPETPQLVGIASYALKNPASSIKDGIELSNDSDVQKLINSSKIRRMVNNKDVLGLMVAPEINAVLDKQAVQRILEGTNVLGDVDVTDKTAVKMRITQEVMTTLARVELIKQNPRFKQLSNDAELSRMLNKGDVFGLMASPKAKEMAQIIMDSGVIK